MSTANHKCVYVDCSNRKRLNKDISFFRFPVKDSARTVEWQKNCGNIKIALMEVDNLKNKLICEEHFLPGDFLVNKKRKLLIKSAVPVRFVKEGKEIVTLSLITVALTYYIETLVAVLPIFQNLFFYNNFAN